MILYHYCTLPTLHRINDEGIIRAYPQRLYRDSSGTRLAYETRPIIWLTENPLGEGTTLAKAMADGYRGDGVGHMSRIAIDVDDAETLLDFTRRTNVPRTAWKWVMATADMINIDPSVWRVLARDIPREQWSAMEVMTAIDSEGTTWGPIGDKRCP